MHDLVELDVIFSLIPPLVMALRILPYSLPRVGRWIRSFNVLSRIGWIPQYAVLFNASRVDISTGTAALMEAAIQPRLHQILLHEYGVVGAAQADWVRSVARLVGARGLEVRAVYVPGEGQNLVLRAYLVEALELESTGASALETGTRFRLDWNISF